MTVIAALPHVFGPTNDIQTWARSNGLQVVLIVIGSILLTRMVTWIGYRVTKRIDDEFKTNDELVRTEQAKHRHAVAQVITWVTIVLVYTIATLMVLDRIGIPISSLVAPATVLGAALGFGAQRIVQDLLAGFFIITERQYGFGDVVNIMAVGAGDPAQGTVEDVTLRVTKLRTADGEVVTIPNGQIVKSINLSRDWARSVIDVPVPATADVNRVNELLVRVGTDAFEDARLRPLLLDTPSVMGVESLSMDEVHVRMVARTLPGKQFDVGRELRARIVTAFARSGIVVQVEPEQTGDSVAEAVQR